MLMKVVSSRTYQIVIAGVSLCLLFGLVDFSVTLADDLPKESVLPLGIANKAIQAALDVCKKDGYRVSVSVVDRDGVLRAMGRADGAGPHTVDSSRKKAYTAASMRGPTANVAELIAKTPAVQGLQYMNDSILFLA